MTNAAAARKARISFLTVSPESHIKSALKGRRGAFWGTLISMRVTLARFRRCINDDRHSHVFMICVIYPVKGVGEGEEGQMRVSREQAAENRKRIVETASRMFRER